MIFWKIFSSEFSYQVKRISTWLYFMVLLAFTLVMVILPSPGDGVYPNNTFLITAISIMGGLFWLIMCGTISGEAAARDVQARIYPLIYASSVSKLNYLGGRFLAAFALNALLLLSFSFGILLYFYFPGIEFLTGTELNELLPFRPWAYLSVYFLISLPFAFIASALQFTFAVLSRRVMTSYIASLLISIFPQVIAISAASVFGNWDLIKLLDPVGISGILGGEMQTWAAPEKNTRLITLEGMFLWNRVSWLGLATGSLILTYFRFSFTIATTKSGLSLFKWRSRIQTKPSLNTAIVRVKEIAVPQAQRNFGLATNFYQLLTITWASFKIIARHPLGLSLVVVFALASAGFGSLIINEQGIPIHPTTQQVLAYLTSPVGNIGSPWVIIPLLIMFFVGELIWRERESGLSEVSDVVPTPDWVFFMGKFLGLGLIIFAWMALLMIGGILMQLHLDYDKLEIGLYLQTLFGLQFLDYLLFALLVMVVHVVVSQKYIGFLVVLLVYTFMAFPSYFGIEHSMLIFGADPGWSYTDMRGFGSTIGPWLWFKAYWIAWAILLAVTARSLWARGREHGFRYRIQLAKRRFHSSTLWVALTGAGLLVSLGSFIFYNTNVLNTYQTSSEILEAKAKYERLYGQYRNTPQPQLTATKLDVELYPERQKARIRGSYTLVNKDSAPVDSIHIGNVSGIEFSEVEFDKPATPVIIDKELSHHIYKLEEPLQSGDSIHINFVLHYNQEGFLHSGTTPLIVENGTYFSNFDLLPNIGYQRLKEINDAGLRKKYKLTARPEIPSLYDQEARKKPISTDHTTLETIIGTTKNEVAIAPGFLHNTWTESDRHYFHYKTDGPIGGEYSILSANYSIKESQWNKVVIKIYYHPDHDQNIDRMLQSAEASLEYYTSQFGPYPFEYLTLIEGAGNGSGASADAGIIYYGEQYALMNPDDSPNGFDLPYYIMAHEVGHQWWGIARLQPAFVEGAGALIEGLSVYSGMQVLEKTYGNSHLQKYINYLHSSYAMPRSLASATLLQADEQFLYYKKGGLAMYTLSKYIGKERVNAALRDLLQKQSSGELSLPTTLDLYQELQQVTPDSLNYLLNDLFKENTYWRLETTQAKAKQTNDGNWEVTLKVKAQKVVVDSTGSEKEIPMNDWLEIGIYEEGKGLDEPLYLRVHQIQSGEQQIKVTVPRKPSSGGIDPNFLMIDVRLEDNIMQLDGS